MYEFTAEEKESIRILIQAYLMMGRYKSTDILRRIDEDRLTKRDLDSIQKKLSIAIQGISSTLPPGKDEFLNRMKIIKSVSIIDSALSRYRVIDWKLHSKTSELIK